MKDNEHGAGMDRTIYSSVSSIYIWSKNFSHSTNVKSEAKGGGH